VPLCGSRQGWIPVERAKAVLSTVLVGSFHQLRGFHGLGAGVNQRTGGPNSAEQISTDQLPHGRASSAFFEPDRRSFPSHPKDVLKAGCYECSLLLQATNDWRAPPDAPINPT
jgi:hypothetical protein